MPRGTLILTGLLLTLAACEDPPADTSERTAATRPAQVAVATTRAARAAEPDADPLALASRLRAAGRGALAAAGRGARRLLRAHRRFGRAILLGLAAEARDPAFWREVGNRAVRRGDLAAGVDAYRRALELRPDDVDALHMLVVCLASQNRPREALRSGRRLIELAGAPGDAGDPEVLVEAHFCIGGAQLQLGRLADAERSFRRVLELAPGSAGALANLAVASRRQGKLGQAERLWRRVVVLEPDWDHAWMALGEVRSALERPEPAFAAYAEVVKQTPKNPAAWINYSLTARRCGRLGAAVVGARRAVGLLPDAAETHRYLGDLLHAAYRADGKPATLRQAISAWTESLRLQPDQPDLRKQVETSRASLPEPASRAASRSKDS